MLHWWEWLGGLRAAIACACIGFVAVLTSCSRAAPPVPAEVTPTAFVDDELFAEIEPIHGDSEIRGPYAGSEIVIKTKDRVAGAIDSVVWNGKEFIDSADHGRQLQSASNFQVDDKFIPETYNPTEAGSLSDGAGPKSTSQLRQLVANGNTLNSSIRMAYWLRPKEFSAGHPAKNTKILSDHLVSKEVVIGYRHWDNVIPIKVQFVFPYDKKYRMGQFEILTGYMPAEFDTYWKFDNAQNKLVPLSDGPGEQGAPVVLANSAATHAMGIWFPTDQYNAIPGLGFGRFRFPAEKVNKWNLVLRKNYEHAEPDPMKLMQEGFMAFVIVGDLKSVEKTMAELTDYVKVRKPGNWSYLDRKPGERPERHYMGTDRSLDKTK